MSHPLEPFRYCPCCGSSHFTVRSEKSKQCADCGFEYFMNTSASTGAFIVNSAGELLVVRRKSEPASGTLDLPGGFIDITQSAKKVVFAGNTGIEIAPDPADVEGFNRYIETYKACIPVDQAAVEYKK